MLALDLLTSVALALLDAPTVCATPDRSEVYVEDGDACGVPGTHAFCTPGAFEPFAAWQACCAGSECTITSGWNVCPQGSAPVCSRSVDWRVCGDAADASGWHLESWVACADSEDVICSEGEAADSPVRVCCDTSGDCTVAVSEDCAGGLSDICGLPVCE